MLLLTVIYKLYYSYFPEATFALKQKFESDAEVSGQMYHLYYTSGHTI